MSLVEVTTQNDEDAIQSIIQSKEYQGLAEPFFWIGASDLGSDNSFYWVKNGQPVVYSSWSEGQPGLSNGENCVEIRGHFNYLWNDHYCSENKYFICEENVGPLCDCNKGSANFPDFNKFFQNLPIKR